MSIILDALVKLEDSIGKLEGSVAHVEGALAGQQRDMFGGGKPAAANVNGQGVDPQMMADKLDNIIEHAETVLKENHG